MHALYRTRNAFLRFAYHDILKRAFFTMDPEYVHDRMTAAGALLGRHAVGRAFISSLFSFSHPALEQTVAGIRFKNPVGLAAGFDKNAELTQIIPSVGFGFEEIGSVTGEPCAGNSGTRLWRLKESQALVVFYGLKNEGADEIAHKLSRLSFDIPIGISLAKTNSTATVEERAGIDDYVKAYEVFRKKGIGAYFTINISCPNAFGGEPFTDPDKLDRLLSALRAADPADTTPIFLKLPAELPHETVDRIVAVARAHRITGFICTNLAKHRDNPAIKETDVPEKGGISGRVVQKLSDDLISYLYRMTGREFVIIGCGGIFSAEDAYEKITRGATLLQLITGMIFEGPQLISDINRGLVELLHKDGYGSISEAIGAATRT